jgi:hypothetical protein
MVNKYPGRCYYCGGYVQKNAGKCWRPAGSRRYLVAHLACADAGAPEVIETTFSSGETIYQNRNGRCEDAPCCGCCSY